MNKNKSNFFIVSRLYKIIGGIIITIITTTGCQNKKIDWYEYQSNIEKGKIIDLNLLSTKCLTEVTGNNSDFYIRLLQAESDAYSLDYTSAIKILLALSDDNNVSNYIKRRAIINLFDIYSINNKSSKWQEKQFEYIDNKSWKNLSKEDLYYYLNLLYYKAVYFRHKSNFKEALANIDFALHILEIKKITKDLPNLMSKLLGAKALIFLHHSFDFNLPAKKLFKRAIEKSSISMDTTLLHKQQINLALCYFQLKDTVSALRILDSLENTISTSAPLSKYYYYTNQGFININLGKTNEGIANFTKALNYFKLKDCSRYEKIIDLYLADAFLSISNIDSSLYYYNAALQLDGCDENEKDQIKSYAQWVKQGIYQYKYLKTNNKIYIDSISSSIKESRKLTLKLFGDKTDLHLDEYFAENLSQFLSNLMEFPKLQVKYSENIINLFEDSKKRQLSLDNLRSTTLTEQSIQLDSLLQKIDDHKEGQNYSWPIYEEIYSHYQSIGKSIQSISFDSIKPISLYSIKNKLEAANAQLINCIEYNNINWCYRLSKNCFTIDSISTSFHSLLSNIHECNSSNNIIFLGDGNLMAKSIELNLPNKNIEYAYSLNQYLSNTELLLSNSKISILSYTNEETQKSLTSKKYSELYNGYQEGKHIQTLFPKSSFFNGANMNRENFHASMSSDILHVSSHAYSDSLKRLESYIILRDSLGEPARLYANEILSMPTVPKFVNLSACQTGTGVHMAGAGTYSIARSFLQKGSEAVMKTLWDVDDEATKEFMILFYTKWIEGLSCGEALRMTKNEFRSSDKYAAPKYWAGFILEGNPNLYISKN